MLSSRAFARVVEAGGRHRTLLATMALQEFEKFDSHASAKRNVRDAIQSVAARLGNTPLSQQRLAIAG